MADFASSHLYLRAHTRDVDADRKRRGVIRLRDNGSSTADTVQLYRRDATGAAYEVVDLAVADDLHDAVTVSDTASVNLTLTGQALSAAVLPAGVSHASLADLTTGDPHTQYLLETGGTISGNLAVDGNTALGNGDDDETAIRGHLIFEGEAPSVSFGAAAGTSPVLNGVAGTDGGFRVVFTTGTSTTTGLLFTVTFSDAWTSDEYHVSVTPYDSDAGTMIAGGYFIDHANKDEAGFPFHVQTAPPESTSHFLDFIVVGGT